jgi:hypothetical protein
MARPIDDISLSSIKVLNRRRFHIEILRMHNLIYSFFQRRIIEVLRRSKLRKKGNREESIEMISIQKGWLKSKLLCY